MSDFKIITASLLVIGLLRPESKTGNELFPPQNETSSKQIKMEREKCYQIALQVLT